MLQALALQVFQNQTEKKKKERKNLYWNSRCGSAEMYPTRNHEVAGSILGLVQLVKDLALP